MAGNSWKSRWSPRSLALAVVLGTVVAACGEAPEAGAPEEAEFGARMQARIESALQQSAVALQARADSIADALQPIPLLSGAEESALRRYLNQAHLAQARRLGVSRPEDEAELQALQQQGRLVPLDSTEYYVVRELDHSVPLVTPDTRAMLAEIGQRFHARLDSLGLPPFRYEITSALRTAETQAALRRINPNAAAGVSTHEFGTTVDIAYNSFAAPADPIIPVGAPDDPWLEPYLQRSAEYVAESVAARGSRELQAVLGRVLREMQAEGKVLVTLERGQPVYHITVGQSY